MQIACWISPTSAALLAVLAGCEPQSTEVPEEVCWDQTSPTGGESDSAKLRGQVALSHEVTYEGVSAKTSRGISASFADFTAAHMEPRTGDLKIGDQTCSGFTGAPYKVCTDPKTPSDQCFIEALDVDRVELEGLGSGKVTLTRVTEGKFNNLDVKDPLFGSGPAKVVVTSPGGAKKFPAYNQSLDALELLELQRPNPSGITPVGTGDLMVRWKPGNGDAVILELKKTDPKIYDKVRCIVKDKGCHAVLVGALEWLEVQPGQQFKLVLRRVRSTSKALDGNTSVELNAESMVETTFTR